MYVIYYLKREVYTDTLGKLQESLTVPIHDTDLRITWDYINRLREMGHKLPTMHTLEHIAMDRLFMIVGKILKHSWEVKNGGEKEEVYGITKTDAKNGTK